MTKLGFDEPEWEDAKREGKAILTERAKQKQCYESKADLTPY